MTDWYRLDVAILPPDGVAIDHLLEQKIYRAIGDVIGSWTMLYGGKIEVIPIAERSYPMVSKPGPFAAHQPHCPDAEEHVAGVQCKECAR